MAETTSPNYPAALADSTSLLGDHSNQLSLTLGATCLIDADVITMTGAIATEAGGVEDAPGYCLIDSEIIHFTGVSGSTLTGCTRPSNAVGGGAKAQHEVGSTVYFIPTANWANQVKDEIIATQTELGINVAGQPTNLVTRLDRGMLEADNAATEALATTKTLTDADFALQYLDPNGANRDVNLPAEAAANHAFVIVNTADAAENLVVKNDAAATIVTVGQSQLGMLFSDGTTWKGSVDGPSIKGGDISSASPLPIDTDGDYFDVTGTNNFAAMTVAADRQFTLQFDAGLTMTHHATNLDLPGEDDITTVAGDVGVFQSTGANTVQCISYTKADGTAVVSAGGLFASYAIIADQKAANTHSGTFTQDAWQTRDLGHEITDPDGIVAVDTPSANQFQLAAGSYLIKWSAPAYQVGAHQTRLADITADPDEYVYGTSEVSTASDTASRSFGSARVVAPSTNAYEIQHYCTTTVASSGLGERNNFGNVLYYTLVEIYKES